MKRSATVGLALASLLVLVGTAYAGEYHSGTTLLCSDCHTMHYSMQHGYDGGAPPNWVGGGGPYHYLLINSENALCATCHDGQNFAPDVVGANFNSYDREGGGLTTGANPYEDWKGHTLGSHDVAPGGTWSATDGLTCVSCHAQHGNVSGNDVFGHTLTGSMGYRNLRSRPGSASGNIPVSYAKGTNDTTYDVFMRGWTKGDLSGNYGIANVDLNEPVSTNSGIGRWCSGCHTNFHGKQGDANMGGTGGTEWLRHPTADANIGAAGGGHSSKDTFKGRLYRVKVMSPSGDWGTQGEAWTTIPSDLTPTCISCHKGHGNQRPFGLIYAQGAAPLGEDGDGTLAKDLCKQCHRQG